MSNLEEALKHLDPASLEHARASLEEAETTVSVLRKLLADAEANLWNAKEFLRRKEAVSSLFMPAPPLSLEHPRVAEEEAAHPTTPDYEVY